MTCIACEILPAEKQFVIVPRDMGTDVKKLMALNKEDNYASIGTIKVSLVLAYTVLGRKLGGEKELVMHWANLLLDLSKN